jgi:hypothetical protein
VASPWEKGCVKPGQRSWRKEVQAPKVNLEPQQELRTSVSVYLTLRIRVYVMNDVSSVGGGVC